MLAHEYYFLYSKRAEKDVLQFSIRRRKRSIYFLCSDLEITDVNQVQASVRMYGCCYLTKIGIVSFNALSKEIIGCSC